MGSLGKAKCEKLSNCQPWQKQLHTLASGWHRNNALLNLETLPPCFSDCGWARVYGSLGATRSKYMHLINPCAIYGTTRFSNEHKVQTMRSKSSMIWFFFWFLAFFFFLPVGSVVRARSSGIKTSLHEGQDLLTCSSSFNLFLSRIFSHNAHYLSHKGPIKC